MKKQTTPCNKFLLFIMLLIVLVLLIGVYLLKENSSGKVENPSITSPSDKETLDHNPEKFVQETFFLSKEGKVPNIPFVSGKTSWMEVNEAWGTAQNISETDKGRYEEYKSHSSTIGYAGDIVNDIRSYDANLQTISFMDVKKIGGEPDQIRYYKDSTHDQMILVYQVTASTELLWVLPIVTEQQPNPKVDHISLYTRSEFSEAISKMSVEEKIGQMILAGISGTTMDTNTKSLIGKFHVGGIIFYENNFETPTQTVQLVNQIKTENQSNLPLLLSTDQEGGRVTRLPGGLVHFPTNKQIGKINNPEFSYKIGTFLGHELKEFGLNLNFAPVLDINSNPNNPVIGDRSFWDNAEIVSNLGIQTMKGIASQNVIPTIKHFPGHGDTSVDSHLELPIVNKSLEELRELELIPFERAIREGADVVMVAHILLPELDKSQPASMSQAVMTDVLRKELGFTGVIITDDMTMGAITNHYDIGKAAVQSVKAGSDIILVGHDYRNVEKVFTSLKTAVENGEISQQKVNQSVERIMALKKQYGVNNEKVENPDVNALNQLINQFLN
ncbi:beta-N-acetylhexosaminidase [Ureibacillus xyleni]|uniref:beta-N-acetylhexosaminidase n=1 Tax=Ureibacillus xyleni TaxID=614648 RepID=A0A285TPP2_9BACL|nr:beta-N-acetylhexosaminidase [Ureibacillus xyleni]SOC25201.1 beta-N-acetylhexosaminidase [Ureibacillus xyleni]